MKKEQPTERKDCERDLCLLHSKNLLNSNDIAESEENGIPNLPTAEIAHIKPVESDKDVQPCNLNSQQGS